MDWFESVLDACCLLEDIDAMPEGDATQVGEKGGKCSPIPSIAYDLMHARAHVHACLCVNTLINRVCLSNSGFCLSGGQKQRIALARAIYARKRVYILDSPLSALDQNVRSTIWRRGILGLLTRRDSQPQASSFGEATPPVTVIIASHYGEELFFSRDSSSPSASAIDWIIKVEDGRIVDQGAPRDVLSKMYAERLNEFKDLSKASPPDKAHVAEGSPGMRKNSSKNTLESEEG